MFALLLCVYLVSQRFHPTNICYERKGDVDESLQMVFVITDSKSKENVYPLKEYPLIIF